MIEQQLAAVLPQLPVSRSSAVCPTWREFERGSTTIAGFKRIVVVSGHGVNPPYLAVAGNELHYRTGRDGARL